MKKPMEILDRILCGSGTAPVSLPGVPIVEIAGDQRVLIENHKGVCSYSPVEVLARTGLGYISVTGECLNLAVMNAEQLVITGKIHQIILKGKEK